MKQRHIVYIFLILLICLPTISFGSSGVMKFNAPISVYGKVEFDMTKDQVKKLVTNANESEDILIIKSDSLAGRGGYVDYLFSEDDLFYRCVYTFNSPDGYEATDASLTEKYGTPRYSDKLGGNLNFSKRSGKPHKASDYGSSFLNASIRQSFDRHPLMTNVDTVDSDYIEVENVQARAWHEVTSLEMVLGVPKYSQWIIETPTGFILIEHSLVEIKTNKCVYSYNTHNSSLMTDRIYTNYSKSFERIAYSKLTDSEYIELSKYLNAANDDL